MNNSWLLTIKLFNNSLLFILLNSFDIEITTFDMEITKQKLKEIYDNNSNQKAAKILKISIPTLLKYIKKSGIKMKGAPSHSKLKII